MIIFEYPYLAFLVFLPFLIRLLHIKGTSTFDRALRIPFLKDIKSIQSIKSVLGSFSGPSLFNLSFWVLFLAWCLVVLSLMRPVELGNPQRIENKGRDILLVTDISTSMLEEDFVYMHRRISRMEAVRAVVSDFVKNRLHDRLGLILFGTRAYLQAPLTFDRQAVLDVLDQMRAGMAGQSTSLGDAVGLALKTLKKSKTTKDNQVIILLTDGESNDGYMSVAEAINLAYEEGVKIYTIGVGSPQKSLVDAFFGIQHNSALDEAFLKELAEKTKGRYFKVENLKDLINVYQKIDTLEEQDFEDHFIQNKTELYYIPFFAAFLWILVVLLYVVLFRRGK